jgi:hypothetical protein
VRQVVDEAAGVLLARLNVTASARKPFAAVWKTCLKDLKNSPPHLGPLVQKGIVMTIHKNEEWVQIATIDDNDQIWFTAEFREIVEEMGWAAKQLVGHLLAIWYDPFEHMLDYGSGEARHTADQPGEYDRNLLDEPQEVVEYWAVDWHNNGSFATPSHLAGSGLDLGIEWYRDVQRAKLASIRLPKRLLVEYRDRYMEEYERIVADMESDPNVIKLDGMYLVPPSNYGESDSGKDSEAPG